MRKCGPWSLVPPNCTLANNSLLVYHDPAKLRQYAGQVQPFLESSGRQAALPTTCRPSVQPEVGLSGHWRLYCIWHSQHLWNPPFKFSANHFLTVLHKVDIFGGMIGKMSCRLLFKFLSSWLAPVLSSSLSSQSPILSHVTNNNISRVVFSFLPSFLPSYIPSFLPLSLLSSFLSFKLVVMQIVLLSPKCFWARAY